MEVRNGSSSFFDGGLFSLIGYSILAGIMAALTFGIAYPWALCMLYSWKINHMVIEGKRMRFIGSGISLFGYWVKWLFLTIITVGIYGFWVNIKLEDWKVRNTIFVN